MIIVMWLFLAGFGLTYMELFINMVSSPNERFSLNRGRITGFSKTSVWSLLTYITGGVMTLAVYVILSRFIGGIHFLFQMIIFSFVSGFISVAWEITLGLFYTIIGARHWDYRQTARNKVNVFFANMFRGHTDILHVLIYLSIQPVVFTIWYFT